jgi:hypothetical protein
VYRINARPTDDDADVVSWIRARKQHRRRLIACVAFLFALAACVGLLVRKSPRHARARKALATPPPAEREAGRVEAQRTLEIVFVGRVESSSYLDWRSTDIGSDPSHGASIAYRVLEPILPAGHWGKHVIVWYPNMYLDALPDDGTHVMVHATCDEVSCSDRARWLARATPKVIAEWKRLNPP